MHPHSVLVTVTGHDRPGVTSALFAALAAHDVEVLDVEQVVISDRLVLGVMLALHGDPAPLRRAVTHAAEALGTEVDVSITEDPDEIALQVPLRHHVLVLGRPLRAGAVGEMARRISDLGGNIHSIVRLTHRPVTALELVVSGVDPHRLGSGLVAGAAAAGVDVAVERAGLQRRAKRLLLLDLDTVVVGPEPFAALADEVGRGEESRRLLEDAAGRISAEVVRARAELLAGAPVTVLDTLRARMRWTPGSRSLLGSARRAGHRAGIVSTGIAQVGEQLVDGLALDFLAANRLETEDGRLTGRIVGEVVGTGGRGRALARFAESYGVPLTQTVAVGCGGEAAELLRLAGLGVIVDAARPTPTDREPDRSAHLDALQFVLGLRMDDPDDPARHPDALAATRPAR